MSSKLEPVAPSTDRQSPPARTPLSPRRRRLRWTVAVLSAVVVIGTVAGGVIYRAKRPRLYRPDEQNAEITSSLARNLPPEAPRPRFADVTQQAGLGGFRTFAGDRTSQLPEDMGGGAAWGDFDNDGNEDLFLVSAGGPLGAPAEKLAACELYRNLGNGTFQKVEGFPETRIHGMGAAWADYDGDGYLDIVVTGYNTLLLFHNEGGSGRFTRDTQLPDLKGFWSSASWGDYDNDRRPDLYVCGYVQYTENEADRKRISQQISTAVPYTLNPASYAGGTNLLFHNNGDGTFTEVGVQLGVGNPTGRSLGGLWHDFDDDGWLDLYVANDISDNVLYRNTGGKFEDISHAAWVADYRSAMGLAAGDYDRDGDDDLFIGHWVAQENALYDNLYADFNRRSAATNAAAASGSPAPQKHYALRFMDVADQKGLGQIALPVVSWGCEFVDFDGDGWPDLVVANGSTLEADGPPPKRLKAEEPFLFWNRRGEFFHNLAALSPPLAEKHVARGLAAADYDNDGAMDIVIVHLDGGVQLLRNEMQTGNWLKLRLRSGTANGSPTGHGDGAKVIARVGGVALRRTVSSVSYLSQSSRIVHFGLGAASEAERIEVRWLGGGTNAYEHLAPNNTWEISEGEAVAKRVGTRVAPAGGAAPYAPLTDPAPKGAAFLAGDERARVVEFWSRQRAAMNAMKVDNDITNATALFRAALELNPNHEDSRYYLANCLALQGDWAGALAQLSELTRINPQSHRGFAQWGTLRAVSARTDAELAEAERSLEKARAINPEETGVLVTLGEVALLRADAPRAEELLAHAGRTNPKAVGAFFLRGYLAWKRGDSAVAASLLKQAREALGPDWQPKGATSEGDVKQKQHLEKTPLSRFSEGWNGGLEPASAFLSLDDFLRSRSAH